jgi:hypothetical protein
MNLMDCISIFVKGRDLSWFTPGALAVLHVGSDITDCGIKRSVRRGAPEPRHPPLYQHRTITDWEML